MGDYTTLRVTRSAAVPEVEVVSLNRPDALNAMSVRMIDELLRYFQTRVEDSLSVAPPSERFVPRVIVLRGEGRAFCAGLDLVSGAAVNGSASAGFGGGNAAASFIVQRKISEIVVRMRRCPQPIISLLQGATCGGGFALALASDARIVSRTFKGNTAMSVIGLSSCDIGISYLLPRVIGLTRASELMLTGVREPRRRGAVGN